MNFFTSDWWANGCDNAEAVFAKYERYFATIRDHLPIQLVEFEADHTLHDAEIKRISSDFTRQIVVMVLDGWDTNLQYPVRYTLTFSGVSQLDQILPAQNYVESELGNLGYWECELVRSGVEIRMLFVSTAEFRIVFQGFNFSHESRQRA